MDREHFGARDDLSVLKIAEIGFIYVSRIDELSIR